MGRRSHGAALAATIVIAVYEGRVRVVNARGQANAQVSPPGSCRNGCTRKRWLNHPAD